MAGADQPLAGDEAVADPAAIVRARILDDDDPAALEAGHGDIGGAIPGPDDPADRDVDRAHIHQLRNPVVGVVAQLVDHLRLDRAHDPPYAAGLTPHETN